MTTEAKMPIKAVLGATSASLANVSPAPGTAGLIERKMDQSAGFGVNHIWVFEAFTGAETIPRGCCNNISSQS